MIGKNSVELNLISPWNQLGYGVASVNVAKFWERKYSNVSYWPIGNPESNLEPDLLQKILERRILFNSKAPSVRIWHQHQMDLWPGSGQRIGWPIFELDKFTDIEKHHLNSCDKLAVCSPWAKKIIEQNGIKVPTFVVPLGVDTDIFKPLAISRTNKDATVFLNIGKWERRKGHEELCEAFSKAFTKNDNVELWLSCDNPFIGVRNDEWRRRFINSPLGHKIKFYGRVTTSQEMANLINQSDIGVFPIKAEGFCLPALEMMACNKPIIITDYSGPEQFCIPELKLSTSEMEEARDGVFFHGQGKWATIFIDQLIYKMQLAHQKKQAGSLMNIEQFVKDNFTWNHTVAKLEEAIKA